MGRFVGALLVTGSLAACGSSVPGKSEGPNTEIQANQSGKTDSPKLDNSKIHLQANVVGDHLEIRIFGELGSVISQSSKNFNGENLQLRLTQGSAQDQFALAISGADANSLGFNVVDGHVDQILSFLAGDNTARVEFEIFYKDISLLKGSLIAGQ